MTPLLAGAPQAVIREFSQQRAQRGRYISAADGGSPYTTAQRSLRFNSADSASLSRTPASAGNQKTWTWSSWVKKSRINTGDQVNNLFAAGSTFFVRFSDDDGGNNLRIYNSSPSCSLVTSSKFRDPSAWYHIVIVCDTTQATASNRLKMYVNNVQQTTFFEATYPAQNADLLWNSTNAHLISGLDGYLALVHFIDGYAYDPSYFGETDATTGQWIAKTYSGSYGTNGFFLDFADNSNNTAATLGKDNSGVNSNNWTPDNFAVSASPTIGQSGDIVKIAGRGGAGGTSDVTEVLVVNGTQVYSGTGVANYTIPNAYLPIRSFSIVASGQNTYITQVTVNGSRLTGASYGLGANGYYYTFNGGAFDANTSGSYASSGNGNTTSRVNTLYWTSSASIIDSLRENPVSAGVDSGLGNEVSGNYATLNLLAKNSAATLSDGNLSFNGNTPAYGVVYASIGIRSGKYYWEWTPSPTSNNHAGISRELIYDDFVGGDSRQYAIQKNGQKINGSGSDTNYASAWGANDVLGVAFDADNGTLTYYINGVSQGVAFSGINTSYTWFPGFSMYNRDYAPGSVNFGQRSFAHNAPSGFSPLVDTLLPTPTIAKPNTVMDVKLYTGNGSTQTISGLNFSPDLVWIKNRSHGRDNNVYDTVRGATKLLSTNSTTVDVYNGTGSEQTVSGLTAFNSDGFTVGSDNVANQNTPYTYVAWAWDAGSSNAPNNSGTIASTVRANISAGFSVVTWSGTTANATVGHGLGVAPQFILFKTRGNAYNWRVYHASLGNTKALILNLTNTPATSATYFNNTSPTSTLIHLGTSDETNDASMVAYCWAPVAGYSAFGSYTGNGSSDGPFVYTGFSPRWILVRNESVTQSWALNDTARATYNLVDAYLAPNLSGSEQTTYAKMDILSNGFKVRETDSFINGNGNTHIFAAFAEAPFPYARAR